MPIKNVNFKNKKCKNCSGCTCNIDENDEIYKYIDKSINNLVDNALYHI